MAHFLVLLIMFYDFLGLDSFISVSNFVNFSIYSLDTRITLDRNNMYYERVVSLLYW